jgi:hypothetical protein
MPWGTVYEINGNVAWYTRELYNLRTERRWSLSEIANSKLV